MAVFQESSSFKIRRRVRPGVNFFKGFDGDFGVDLGGVDPGVAVGGGAGMSGLPSIALAKDWSIGTEPVKFAGKVME